jgi:hypothetical protein
MTVDVAMMPSCISMGKIAGHMPDPVELDACRPSCPD